MNQVNEFIEKLNIKNKTVVLAISGGPDSMFLFNLFIKLRKKFNLKIVVAHVHHNIRKESTYEAEMVKDIALRNNVVFEFMKIDKYPNNKFSEDNARKIRYDFFEKILKKYNSDILFTAHHGDDLIETILMKIVRGSSIKGYAGFESISKRNGYIIARPLIYLSKNEILEYLDKNKLWYALDLSNNSQEYKRNRIRKNVLPVLKKENKSVHVKFLQFSNKLLELNSYITSIVKELEKDIIHDNTIDVKKFNEREDLIKKYILEDYMYSIYKHNIISIFDTHIDLIIEMLKVNNNSKISLPNNKIGLLEYNCFKIVDNIKNDYDYEFDDYIELPNKSLIIKDNNTDLTSNYVIHLNSKEIYLPFHVRNMKIGDKMTIKNFNGKKSVSDIFTDSKISKEIRHMYPIVTDSKNNILWIPGIKKSNFDRKKVGKYDIILKYDTKGGK